MSERVVDYVVEKYPQSNGRQLLPNRTDRLLLTGGPFANSREVKDYQQAIGQVISRLELPSYYAAYLVSNYGRQSEIILEKAKTYESEAEIALARAEAWFTVENELVLSPMDFFNRRTGRLYFNLPSIHRVLTAVLRDFQQYFNWKEERLALETEAVKQALHDASRFEYASEGEAAAD